MRHNLDAERTILGAVLVEPSALASAAAFLKAGDFFDQKHRLIYGAMLEGFETGAGVDLVTVKAALGTRLEAAGGVPYLAGLTDGLPRLTNIETWARLVKDAAVQRRVAEAADKVRAAAADSRDGAEAVDLALKAVMEAADESTAATWGDPDDDLRGGVAAIERVFAGNSIGVQTGLVDLDRQIGGLKPGELILVGARPSVGKTAFAVTVGENVARAGLKVGLLSLEMTRDQISMRRVLGEAGVSIQQIRRKDERAIEKVVKAMGRMQGRAFFVDDTFTSTAAQVRAKVRQLIQRRGQLDLVIVDYLGLMSGTGRAENRVQEVSELSRSLKIMAKDLKVPVLALSQLNRQSEHRDGKRPQLSDLRDSGSLEQDADVVLLLHRAGLDAEEAELIVAKQRNGPTGSITLRFDRETTQFQSVEEFKSWTAADYRPPA